MSVRESVVLSLSQSELLFNSQNALFIYFCFVFAFINQNITAIKLVKNKNKKFKNEKQCGLSKMC